ncbi:ABC transporter substrate-binding protein [Clostridium formicaceticum]|uniref:ABC transporter substrate-binding protein n=1 Tax=Clostridium formicaceticum TaxID=1497 RepID=A0AAC9RQD5_9CLOT|nr:ABC transporter substrate-binding protein [Clostridium formicaceticum]AOY77794.1 ABC transporter substrate-binding protein [Clostridium formicaceticum]ARE88400.1 vitamin B12-transporter protein BtuF [Clostridium formicaceticum]
MKAKAYMKMIVVLLIVSLVLGGCGKAVEKQNEQVSTEQSQRMDEQKSNVQGNETRKVVDMAGRTVEVPTEIKKVYTTGQIGIVLLYTINPDKLAGWGFPLAQGEKKYIPEKYWDLPVLGSWSGKNNKGNIEEIIRVHPDVIFAIGELGDSQKELADNLQEQIGIPVVMVEAPLDKLDKAYEFVGDIMGEQDRCKDLADYCFKTISTIKMQVESVPEESRVSVYYAEGPKGLETDPKGSSHTEVLDFVGGINVADVPMQQGYGRSAVSLEQVLKWDPDIIITGYDKDLGGEGFFADVFKNSDWQGLKAVKDKRVYQIPSYPFDWFDRPPSVNRIIGVKWLANLLYPEFVDIDIVAEVKEYYEKFYNKKLTDDEVKQLLQNAGGE